MSFLYTNKLDFEKYEEKPLIEACFDLSLLAASLNLPALVGYLTIFLVRRINLRTIGVLAPHFKDT